MNTPERLVWFSCPGCDQCFKSPAKNAGRRCRCPRCSIMMEVPGPLRALAVRPPVSPSPEARPAVRPVVSPSPKARPVVRAYPVVPVRQEQATVPLKIALPENLGSMETTVSQDTADNVAKVVTGGFLVVLGIAVAAFFGIRRPSV